MPDKQKELIENLIFWIYEHCPTTEDFQIALRHCGMTEEEVKEIKEDYKNGRI